MNMQSKPSGGFFHALLSPRRGWKKALILLFPVFLIAIAAALPLHAQQPYSWHKDRQNRIALDFNKTHEEVKNYISRYIPDVTDSLMAMWEQSRALETYYINGKKHYFHSAGPNLFRIDEGCRAIKKGADKVGDSGTLIDDRENIPAIMKNAGADHMAEQKRMRVKYTITVKPDAVPDGTMLRCWMPFPRTDVKRQTGVRLISTSQDKFVRSPMSCDHSSIYMEQRARKGQPTVFSEEFEFTSAGAWFNLQPDDVKPYDRRSAAYRKFTENRRQHLIVTPRLRQLADSITQESAASGPRHIQLHQRPFPVGFSPRIQHHSQYSGICCRQQTWRLRSGNPAFPYALSGERHSGPFPKRFYDAPARAEPARLVRDLLRRSRLGSGRPIVWRARICTG